MKYLLLVLAMVLVGCADPNYVAPMKKPPQVQLSPNGIFDYKQLDGKKMTIAVYGFGDKTGQRKQSNGAALLSSAVTQGAEVWVIKALQDVGACTWFEVVERVGLDNLVKERQLVRNTREIYEKNSTQ